MRVFISYRRDDSSYAAQHLYDQLRARLGPGHVVFDVDSIPPGADFRSYINKHVENCDILLAVIGDRWLEILQERINDPKDFVRFEIAAALKANLLVIPVLVGKASMPAETALPPDLSFAYSNAVELRAGRDRDAHTQRLINGLEEALKHHVAEVAEAQREQDSEPLAEVARGPKLLPDARRHRWLLLLTGAVIVGVPSVVAVSERGRRVEAEALVKPILDRGTAELVADSLNLVNDSLRVAYDNVSSDGDRDAFLETLDWAQSVTGSEFGPCQYSSPDQVTRVNQLACEARNILNGQVVSLARSVDGELPLDMEHFDSLAAEYDLKRDELEVEVKRLKWQAGNSPIPPNLGGN